MPNPRLTGLHLPVIILLVLLALTGCSLAGAPTSTPTVKPLAAITATSRPTPTPAPKGGRVMLVVPPGSEGAAPPYLTVLNEMASTTHDQVSQVASVQPADLNDDVKVVVLLSAPANLTELLAANSRVQFVVVSAEDQPAVANLSVLRYHREQAAFIAGYIAALTANDWRMGGLFPSEAPLGASLQDAFTRGGHYFCGRCTPAYPPFVVFPITGAMPSTSSPAEWQTAVVELLKNNLDVLYVSPEASNPDFIRSLAGQNVLFIGSQSPPEEVRPRWIATILMDGNAALRTAWPDVRQGKGGKVIGISPQLVDVQPAYLSEGKLRLVRETLEGLSSGAIYPFSVPLQ